MVPTIEEEEAEQRASAESQAQRQQPSKLNKLRDHHNQDTNYRQEEQQVAPPTGTNYLSSLLEKSSVLLQTLRQQYTGSRSPIKQQTTGQQMERYSQPQLEEEQKRDAAAAGSLLGAGGERKLARSTTLTSGKPPLPPPPSEEVLRAASASQAALAASAGSQQQPAPQQPQPVSSMTGSGGVHSPAAGARRHALQEQSLERDAALSLKSRDLKHKRTSSIKSALRHAHLGSLRGDKRGRGAGSHHLFGDGGGGTMGEAGGGSGGGGKGSKSAAANSSMPYELFEPPVTQRTLQRSKRRGAMLDPKRQMSADTIGLRQLTDEYLHNAGVKPMSSSNQCSLVALTGPLGTLPACSSAGSALGASSTPPAVGSSGGGSLSQVAAAASGGSMGQAGVSAAGGGGNPNRFAAIESQLYLASKRTVFGGGTGAGSSGTEGSVDSLSQVNIYPGNLPWQSDVSIQCELLQPPPPPDAAEPYETTGDILNTMAGPFRGAATSGGSALEAAAANSQQLLGATLKRGLTAISQHHLSPVGGVGAPTAAAALNVVGSCLKKSLSNTLDISKQVHHLHSQDSLPAYTNLLNEPESPPNSARGQDGGDRRRLGLACEWAAGERSDSDLRRQPEELADGQSSAGGLIGSLANRLGRQSSKKKFSVSRKGLQRALSFDCRGGYKRLDGQSQSGSQQQQQNHSSGSGNQHKSNYLSASNQQEHNKSTLCLTVDRSAPRPYLPQSASQVDFQLPLLPYHKMQEAIVNQRLIEPSARQAAAAAANSGATGSDANNEELAPSGRQQLDADQLLCGGGQQQPAQVSEQPLTSGEQPISCQVEQDKDKKRDSSGSATDLSQQQQQTQLQPTSSCRGSAQRTAPRLALDIPTIAAPTGSRTPETSGAAKQENEDEEEEDGGEEVCGQDEDSKATVIVCLPSPNVAIDPGFSSMLPGSFCQLIGQQQNQQQPQTGSGGLLTANDVFSNSKNLIKRPSTMIMSGGDTMAQALAAGSQRQQASTDVPVVLRNRRQAIVPPKLTTDATEATSGGSGDEQAATGQLVELGPDEDSCDGGGEQESPPERTRRSLAGADQLSSDEATVRALRRKRSGGGAQQQQQQQYHTLGAGRRLSGSQTALPTFCIEPEADRELAASGGGRQAASATPNARHTPEFEWSVRRPDSQATNADSLVSSGSSTNLSAAAAGKRTGDFTVTSPGGLTVSFGSSRGRRRSSIAVIPQMQICPGDLLVYSKQLIDRMNQSDDNEPPTFLTIDDKKNKNIWSSFKLFDNRTIKARNELLCSLEDVLASLQPSTFVDEQLSHYKGMLWNEFLYETESRRSQSSEILSMEHNGNNSSQEQDPEQEPEAADEGGGGGMESQLQVRISAPLPSRDPELAAVLSTGASQQQTGSSAPQQREALKGTLSSGGGVGVAANSSGANSSPHRTPHHRPPLSSRFKEKPKLKRGQTVDSVFRIPLVPSSPLKHAQQHQQTPTAHLEEHNASLNEEDERSSATGSSLGGSENDRAAAAASAQPAPDSPPQQQQQPELPAGRRNRSASTRSRTGSSGGRCLLGAGASGEPPANSAATRGGHFGQDPDSSFETDDAMDMIVGPAWADGGATSGSGQRQRQQAAGGQSRGAPGGPMQRQSSLSTLSSTVTRTEQKRQRALWDLFQSECAFFFDHLLTLKNVYMEPLKKIQVEGFAMFADPDVLFGNLDELCCGVYDFCKEFLYIIMRTLKTRPEELNATDVLIKLYKKNPKIDHLRGVYHRYTLNYINALTYLESLRRQVEFVEFEKWSSRDVRCKKLQLTDLLVAPVQHIMRVPIILKDIESHTELARDRDEIRAILAVEEASLRELDDKMRWLKNFERLLEIQKNISWPSVLELDSGKLFIPEFLKDVLSKQPCEKLIVSPRRQIVHEGTLSNLDLGKACDMHVILFDDMLLLTRRKKGLAKKASTVCKTNSSGSSSAKDDGSFKYIVYKQPLSLDRFYVHDVQQVDAHSIGLKHLFLLIVMNRFQQITNVHSFSAPNDDIKQTWLFKIKKTVERWKKNFSSGQTEEQAAGHQNSVAQQPHSQQHKSSTGSGGHNQTGGHRDSSYNSLQESGQLNRPITPQVVELSAAMRQPPVIVTNSGNGRHSAAGGQSPGGSASKMQATGYQQTSSSLSGPPAGDHHQRPAIELVVTSASENSSSACH